MTTDTDALLATVRANTFDNDALAALDSLAAEITRLREYEALVNESGLVFTDERLSYAEIQVAREDYQRLTGESSLEPTPIAPDYWETAE